MSVNLVAPLNQTPASFQSWGCFPSVSFLEHLCHPAGSVINELTKSLTSVCSPFVWELCLPFSNYTLTTLQVLLFLSFCFSQMPILHPETQAANTGLSPPCPMLWCHLLLFHSPKHPRPESASQRLKVWCNSANTTCRGALWSLSEPPPWLRMGSLSPWAACDPLFLAVSLIKSYLLPADIPLFLFIS